MKKATFSYITILLILIPNKNQLFKIWLQKFKSLLLTPKHNSLLLSKSIPDTSLIFLYFTLLILAKLKMENIISNSNIIKMNSLISLFTTLWLSIIMMSGKSYLNISIFLKSMLEKNLIMNSMFQNHLLFTLKFSNALEK
jgi:hypothetical protein